MKNAFLLCLGLCLISKLAYAQIPTTQCRMIESPMAKQRVDKKSGLSTQSVNPCGNYYVNVFFHFIRDNNGATGQSVSNVNQYMNILNGAYNSFNVFFIYKGYDEIRNSTWAATSYDFYNNFADYNTTNTRSDAINIYLFRSDNNIAAGIAERISTHCAVGGANAYAANYTLSGVLAHEVGHCVGLLHTHHGTDPSDPGPTSCPENPNGSNGSSCGDFVSDTPADPNILGLNYGNCSAYSRTVGSVTYNPNPQNFMSYATANCLSVFTNGQSLQVKGSLNVFSQLQPVQQISVTVSGSGAVCSSTNVYTLIGAPPGSSITWSISSNIQIVSGQGTASATLQQAPGGSGSGTVTASATICGTTYTSPSMTVYVGAPIISGFKVNGAPFSNGYVCVYSNQYIEALPFQYNTYYTWSITSGNPSNASVNGNSGNTATFQAYQAECFGVSVTAQNTCGTVQSGLSFCAQYCFARYTVYPNPARDQVSIEFDQVDEAEALPDEIDLLSENSTKPVKVINVQDEYQNKRLTNGKSIVLNVKDLQRGIYYLHIKNSRKQDGSIEKIRVILE